MRPLLAIGVGPVPDALGRALVGHGLWRLGIAGHRADLLRDRSR